MIGRPKKIAALYLAAVFAAGAVLGVAAYRFYAVSTASAELQPAPLTPQQYRDQMVAKLQNELSLNPEQTAEVQEIYDYIGDRWHEVRDAMETEFEAIRRERADRIMAILTPEQQDKYRHILEEKLRKRQAAQAGGTGN